MKTNDILEEAEKIARKRFNKRPLKSVWSIVILSVIIVGFCGLCGWIIFRDHTVVPALIGVLFCGYLIWQIDKLYKK